MDFHSTWGDSYGAHYFPTASFTRRSSPTRQPSFNHHGGESPQHHPSTSTFASRTRSYHDENQSTNNQQQRIAADQAYRETFASHERAVFQEEVRSRMRRRDAARNRALFRGRFYRRPEFYAITLGFLGLLYPILNQYVFQPYFERAKHPQPHDEVGLKI
ncbi:hypothetical protein GGR53DRAFT_452036 [Hypoxylon sp. FL1150]|nr:hypothetical protein GGR53DRAFT_452036 [Hypoxylon sp. FL1150]